MNKIIKGVLAGALIVPFSSVIAFTFDWLLFQGDNPGYTLSRALAVGLVFGLYGVIYALAILTLYVVPILLALRKLGFENILSCVIFSLLPTLIFMLFTVVIPEEKEPLLVSFSPYLAVGWYSIVSGVTFSSGSFIHTKGQR